MAIVADILLGAGAIGAAIYCMVLSRKLQRLTQLDSGMGGAIAVLSAQVDEMTRTLGKAQAAARDSAGALEAQTRRAEEAVARIELLLASLHDLPDPTEAEADPPRQRARVLRRRNRRPEAEAAE